MSDVVYTSDSTGKPKGVLVPHAGVVNQVQGSRDHKFLSRPSRVGVGTSYVAECFDSILYLTIGIVGGTLVLLQEAAGLAATDFPIGLTYLSVVLSVNDINSIPPSVKWIDASSEVMTEAALNLIGSSRTLYKAYGSAEVSCRSAGTAVSRERLSSIGRPLSNVTANVVPLEYESSTHQLSPIGVWGELWLGGVQVARGYLNRPALTAERFVANPWPTAHHDRVYRTGDRCRWYADGELEFGGRIDFQVKLRGQRIELGEIEHALRAQPGVVEAVVLLDAALDALVAYVSPAGVIVATGEAVAFTHAPSLVGGVREPREHGERRSRGSGACRLRDGGGAVWPSSVARGHARRAAGVHGAVGGGGRRRVAAHEQRQDRPQAAAGGGGRGERSGRLGRRRGMWVVGRYMVGAISVRTSGSWKRSTTTSSR